MTGAGGMLGRDVVLAAENAGHEVVALAHTDLDVSEPERVSRRFELERPDTVINCAAWTDVDGAEEAEEQAMATNGTGAATPPRWTSPSASALPMSTAPVQSRRFNAALALRSTSCPHLGQLQTRSPSLRSAR